MRICVLWRRIALALIFSSFFVPHPSFCATLYVWTNSPSPGSPYNAWTNAARDIQTAVDAAMAGDTVLVTNGVYDAGGVVVYGLPTNRIALTKPISVLSVNGPGQTKILGQYRTGSDPGVRCAYVTNGALLAGFTLEGGDTASSGDEFEQLRGGGVWCESGGVVSNCLIKGNRAKNNGGGTAYGTIVDCQVFSNTAGWGGGCADGNVIRCAIYWNNASDTGGGMIDGTAEHCEVYSNSATYGGGTAYTTVRQSRVFANTSTASGGGAINGVLEQCAIYNNVAGDSGGGAAYAELRSCTITGNRAAGNDGGGAAWGVLKNCTVVFNEAQYEGGGTRESTCLNTIIYHNATELRDSSEWFLGSFTNSCTTPLPDGQGNFTNAPMLVNASYIYADSPCVGAGSTNYTPATDIDGDAWGSPPSIGCDEPQSPFNGDLDVSIIAENTNVALGYELVFQGTIDGKAASNRWTFGDGVSLFNRSYDVPHAWSVTGGYAVVLSAWNDDHPGGVSATVHVQVVESDFYVDAANTTPSVPYTSWAIAATSIQDAVDAAVLGSTVWVANGVYDTGGATEPLSSRSNRVAITKEVTVRSVNGPNVTFIVGADGTDSYESNAVRCAYVGHNARLSGFSLSDGVSGGDGGGVWCADSAVVSNCVLTGNRSLSNGGGSYGGALVNCELNENSASAGGGSYESTLDGCAVTDNYAANSGGGAAFGVLKNCTVVFNEAQYDGGGIRESTSLNSIIYYNSSEYRDTTNWFLGYFTNCCTAPLPGGQGNLSSLPQLINPASGNFRLSYGSPCIETGNNADAVGDTDLDGNTRIIDGDTDGTATVDMGALEYDRSIYDSDSDGMTDVAEFVADTNPTNPASLFEITSIEVTNSIAVTFACTNSRVYSLGTTTDTVDGLWLTVVGKTNIPGDASGAMSLVDTNPPAGEHGYGFYRVDVQLPPE